jgi:hypothetical protein
MPGRRQLLGASKPPTGTMMYGAAGSTTPLGSGFLATGFLVITAPLGQSHKTLGSATSRGVKADETPRTSDLEGGQAFGPRTTRVPLKQKLSPAE